MRDIIYLGSAPSEEDCAQVGQPDYPEASKAECRAFITAIKRMLRRKPVARGDVWITPYVSLVQDDLSPHEVETRERIEVALGNLQDRMVRHHRAASPSVLRVQQIQAIWNPGTNEIRVSGSGGRSFNWEGSLEQFLGTDILLEVLCKHIKTHGSPREIANRIAV
jgi:hypothetical protein